MEHDGVCGNLPTFSCEDGDEDNVGRVQLCHSFSNTECREEILTAGTTHVAVGFVDLGTLLHATLVNHGPHDGPLTWVGYELSAYACAKTMVVTRLFEDQASVDDILQVCNYIPSCRMRIALHF